MRAFHKPVRRPSEVLEALVPTGDPAISLAHDSAAAFLHRVRASKDPTLARRIVEYAQEHGVDDVAELWADAASDSLPGALWRIYVIRHNVATDPALSGLRFRQGLTAASERDIVVAGSPDAPSPDDVVTLANTIFTGAFTGDFAVALHRAAAFSRIQAAGAAELHSDDDTRAAEVYRRFAADLEAAALRWQQGRLS